MKILFVGEGAHDVGHPDFALKPRPARGVVPALARRVCSEISSSSLTLFWREIPVLNPEKKKRGLAAKVTSAILLAERHECGGTICVHDHDGDDNRLPTLEEGRLRGLALVKDEHRAVCGVAVQSIEAWTLGALTALALVLKQPIEALKEIYRETEAETFNNRSSKPEKQSKKIIAQAASLIHQEDTTDFREQVAEATDVEELIRNCPQGFKRRKVGSGFRSSLVVVLCDSIILEVGKKLGAMPTALRGHGHAK